MYLTTETKGIYKSTDTGTTWKRITASADDNVQKATVLVLDPKSSNILYLGTRKGLYISKDAGKTWEAKSNGIFEKVISISVPQKDNNIIYVSAHLPGQNKYSGKRSFFRSEDGGNTWKNITPDYIKRAGAIAVNPYDPNYVYAGTFLADSSDSTQKMVIIKSKDGGKTWKSIDNGIALSRVYRIIIDKNDSQHLFIICRFGIIEAWDNEAPTK